MIYLSLGALLAAPLAILVIFIWCALGMREPAPPVAVPARPWLPRTPRWQPEARTEPMALPEAVEDELRRMWAILGPDRPA